MSILTINNRQAGRAGLAPRPAAEDEPFQLLRASRRGAGYMQRHCAPCELELRILEHVARRLAPRALPLMLAQVARLAFVCRQDEGMTVKLIHLERGPQALLDEYRFDGNGLQPLARVALWGREAAQGVSLQATVTLDRGRLYTLSYSRAPRPALGNGPMSLLDARLGEVALLAEPQPRAGLRLA